MNETPPPETPDVVAAVDLGSNSFHLMVARRVDDTHLSLVDRLKEPVRLASGLDENEMITAECWARALTCVARFGQQLRGLAPGAVRAVGTNTLRRAKNGRAFLDEAESALGHPIEIISGIEEARLVYLGVAHTVSLPGRRLAIDIGGGSTECILGEGFDVYRADSLFMGCVTWSIGFFPDGNVTEKRFETAELAALQEIATIARPFRRRGFSHAIGSSGTAESIEEILRASGVCDSGITKAGLDWLRDRLVDAKKTSKIDLPGLKPERRDVLPGGVAILRALFEGLEIASMTTSSGALREGLLYDLLGRIRHEDRREQTVQRFQERFHVDVEQAKRVETTALALFDDVAASVPTKIRADWRRALSFAARIHEIGLAVSYTGQQKHAAYLLRYSDMPGFSRDEQEVLSAVVGAHRRKLTKGQFRALGDSRELPLRLVALSLRFAVLLHRSREGIDVPPPDTHVDVQGATIDVRFPPLWLDAHPLTSTDLETERTLLSKIDIELRIK